MTQPTPPPTPEPPKPPPPPAKSKRGIVDDPAPDTPVGPQPHPPSRAGGPVWPGHPDWCTCVHCENGTPPPELAQTRTEVSRETVGTRTHVYWSDGSMTWEKSSGG